MTNTLDLDPLPPGLRLRIRREVLGVTQRDVARLIGTHSARVCDAERGAPSVAPGLLERIGEALATLEAERQGVAA